MSQLGFMYYEGMGVKKNEAKAIEWLSQAAALGDESAINLLESIR